MSQASNAGVVGAAVWLIVLGMVVLFMGHILSENPILAAIILVGMLILTSLIAKRINSLIMRFRLDNLHIEQAVGEIAWRGSSYAAKANGKLLSSIYDEKTTLPPGRYIFFYLAGTYWLLSAEPTSVNLAPVSIARNSPTDGLFVANLAANPTTPSHPLDFDVVSLSRALAQANGFTTADVDANRDGWLSDHQAQALWRSMIGNVVGITVMLIIAALVTGSIFSKDKPDTGSWLLIMFFLSIGIAFFLIPTYRHIFDIASRRVLFLDGFLARDMWRRRERGAKFYYQAANRRFFVPYAGYQALVEGINYRIYYAPKTGKLVSVEPLSTE